MASHLVLASMFVLICFLQRSTTSPSPKECATDVCIREAHRMASWMNRTADPCEDFNQFACGTFINTAVIPPNKTQIGPYSAAYARDLKIYKELLESPDVQHQGKDSYEKKMKRLYKECMDTDAIDAQGLKDYKDEWRRDWPTLNTKWMESSFDLPTLTSKYFKLFTHPLFEFWATVDKTQDIRRHVLTISYAPEMFYWPITFVEKRNHPKLMAIKTYYKDTATALGADPDTAECDAMEIVDFMISFNQMIHKEGKNATIKKSTLQDMNKHFPYLDWVTMIQGMFDSMDMKIDPSEIIFNTPGYFGELDTFLAKYDKMVIQNYFGFMHAINTVGEANDKMRNIQLNFRKVQYGYPSFWKLSSRENYCIGSVKKLYNFGLAKLMSRTRYNSTSQTFIDDMIKNTKAAFKDSAKNISWMGNATKGRLASKLDNMNIKVGVQKEHFEEEDLDEFYKYFEVKGDNYNVDRRQNEIQKEFLNYRLMDTTIKSWRWKLTRSMVMVNARHLGFTNEVVVGLGLMQLPFYKQDNPSYLNFGGLGKTIAHEVGHGFDSYGRLYDEKARKQQWWTDKELEEFKNRTQCFEKQYSKMYVEEAGLYINGKMNLYEIVADHFAIIESFKAYKMYASQHPPELPLPGLGLNNDQLFFLSSAQTNCMRFTPKGLKWRVEEASHMPGAERVTGMLWNSPDFSKTFGCKTGDYMDPAKKCSMW